MCARNIKNRGLIQWNLKVNNSSWYLDCCKKNTNSRKHFCRFFSFLYNTVGKLFKAKERTQMCRFLRASFKEPLHFIHGREKRKEKLTVYGWFNIYSRVTIIRDLRYIWTSIAFNKKISKSHSKFSLLFQALVKPKKLREQEIC